MTTPARARTYAWVAATTGEPRPALVVDATADAPEWRAVVAELTRLAPSVREEPAFV